MGCDSLGTMARPMVDPRTLLKEYFDSDSGTLKVDEAGNPVLNSADQVIDLARSIPFNHMTDVDKLFSLEPRAMGVMFTGITSIGNRTIKSLLGDFKSEDAAFEPSTPNYTVNSVSRRLLKHLRTYYQKEFEDLQEEFRPHLELILAGYDKAGPHPRVAKIDVKQAKISLQKPPFWPVFGGQSREIERIVYGLDLETFVRIEERHVNLLERYAIGLAASHDLEAFQPPKPDDTHRIFTDDFRVPGMVANWGDFSEQNAIDCVGYFVRIMRGAQRFSAHMPTVGGAIHVALISRDMGFRFISRREYSHEDHRVQRA